MYRFGFNRKMGGNKMRRRRFMAPAVVAMLFVNTIIQNALFISAFLLLNKSEIVGDCNIRPEKQMILWGILPFFCLFILALPFPKSSYKPYKQYI